MPDFGDGNIGWEFLARPVGDDGFSYQDDNGGWGYREADGSGSFYGSDGSWGYRSADGGGSYYGADGTWGYWESGGSFSYYGADGGWGYSSSDGNGSYYGADGSYIWWDSDGNYSVTGRSNSSYNAEDGEGGTVEGNEPYSNTSSWRSSSSFREAERYADAVEQEEEQGEKQEARRGARKGLATILAFLRKHWRGCIGSTIALMMVFSVGFAYREYRMLTPIGYGSSDLIGMKADSVQNLLKDAGFLRISEDALCDLSASEAKDVGLVSRVKLIGPDKFSDSWRYPSNLPITIEYHSFKLVSTPISAREAHEKPYEDIVAKFKSAGFETIEVEAAHDLIFGVLHKEGTVDTISIGGKRKFSSGDTFEVCDTVLIRYHSPAFG